MSPPDIKPTFDLPLGNAAQALGFSPDGLLYAQVSEVTLNFWTVLVHFWPELLGAIVGVLWIALPIIIRSAAHRPQSPGQIYCRRCNYNLEGLSASALCPECGNDPRKRKPVAGRTFRRRVAFPASAALFSACVYAAMFLCGVERENAASNFFFWPSPSMDSLLCESLPPTFSGREHRVRKLVEVNLLAGGTVRSVRSIGRSGPLATSLSPDGRTAITTLSGCELAAIDMRNGRIVRERAQLSNISNDMYYRDGWIHVAGWESPNAACIQFMNQSAGTNTLYRWDLVKGSLEKLCGIPAPEFKGYPRGLHFARSLYLIPGSKPLAACETRDGDLEGMWNAPSTIRVRDVVHDGAVLHEFSGYFWPRAQPVFVGNIGRFVICGNDRSYDKLLASQAPSGWDILIGSVTDGATLTPLILPDSVGRVTALRSTHDIVIDEPASICYHEASGRLFISTKHPDAVQVRDVRTNTWIARLVFDYSGSKVESLVVSPDGRWASVGLTEPLSFGGGSRPYRGHLLMFDLSSIGQTTPVNGK